MEEFASIEGCLICGKELVYSQSAYKAVCCGCGEKLDTNAACTDGHFICDACHAEEALPVIYYYCTETDSRDPIEIACAIMRHPAIHMHGPENHVLIGSALLAAWYNCGGDIDLPGSLKIMRERGSQLPGGICGLWGNCGAAVSAGIFLSIVTDGTPLNGESRKLSNLLTSECLKKTSEYSGARCCKRDGFFAIETAADFVADNFGVLMELPEDFTCEFYPRNEECLKKNCPFFVA